MGVRPLGRAVVRQEMGLYLGPTPTSNHQPRFSTEEERMLRHAYAEARREVDSWWTGETYEWRPFEEEREAAKPAPRTYLYPASDGHLHMRLPDGRDVDLVNTVAPIDCLVISR